MFGELCRLCERPAADGGHRAAELDKDKLAEWCLNFLGTTLAGQIDDQDLFCYFCVWDARFYHHQNKTAVNSTDDNDMCWWPEEDAYKNSQDLYKNYAAGKVQQCWVSLEKLPSEEKASSFVGGNAKSKIYKTCCYCNNQFVYLIEHMKKIHADVAIRCNFKLTCCKYFKTVEDREAHVNEFHLKPKIETLSDCIYCSLKGFKKWNLRKHIKAKHCDVAIRCSIKKCALYFKTGAELDLHFETKHKSREEKKKIKCSICNYIACDRRLIENHEAKFHQVQKAIKCSDCTKIFVSKSDMQNHKTHVHNLRKCPACNSKIVISKYYRHFTKRFCRNCKTVFDCLELLGNHEKNCKHGLKCELCLKSFKQKHMLKYHMIMKHLVKNAQSSKSNASVLLCKLNKTKSIRNRKWNCAHCSKEFSAKQSIKTHLARVHNLIEKKHCCNQCSAKFYVASKLKYHIRDIHLKEKVKCKICNKEMHLYYLRYHMINIHCA
ncbi:zinc finger protein 808 isoform X1 [Neocloeon triangulifer]|uniref:zinc finger protein 808 isoform X1 n=1 Tax=Neocloeon triangulifer TaxID=2078957 RepID=UPI00286F94C7|nr:zinc finger protein 808 isoform X1 [Neocloeon triangulifer]